VLEHVVSWLAEENHSWNLKEFFQQTQDQQRLQEPKDPLLLNIHLFLQRPSPKDS